MNPSTSRLNQCTHAMLFDCVCLSEPRTSGQKGAMYDGVGRCTVLDYLATICVMADL